MFLFLCKQCLLSTSLHLDHNRLGLGIWYISLLEKSVVGKFILRLLQEVIIAAVVTYRILLRNNAGAKMAGNRNYIFFADFGCFCLRNQHKIRGRSLDVFRSHR